MFDNYIPNIVKLFVFSHNFKQLVTCLFTVPGVQMMFERNWSFQSADYIYIFTLGSSVIVTKMNNSFNFLEYAHIN